MRIPPQISACLLAILMISSSARSEVCPKAYSEIPIERIQTMFDQIKIKTKWNTNEPMVWGYFFFDPEKDKLAKLAEEMKPSGYKLVELFKGPSMYTLHMEKIEIHTPISLFNRNAELGELALSKCVSKYDGYDVGPVR